VACLAFRGAQVKTLIRNNTQSPVALPLPYTGILSAGEGIVVDEPPNEVVSSLFDGQKSELSNIYTVTQVSQGARSGRISRKETARKIGQALSQAPVDIEINGKRLRKVGTPTASDDAANRAYVDAADARLEGLIEAIPRWVFGERYFELGTAATGTWYVTVSARAASESALTGITVSQHASSTAGPMGTFAVSVSTPVGVAVQSVTLFTYTRVETQPKVVLMLDNPQGPRLAHRFVRPSVLQFPPTNAQQHSPMVSVADSSGQIPETFGILGQLDPTTAYPKIRIVAVGFFSAESNSVADRFYNKPQSLVVQF